MWSAHLKVPGPQQPLCLLEPPQSDPPCCLCARVAATWRLPVQSQELPEPDRFCPTFVATISCLHAQGFEPLEPRPRPSDPATLKAEGARPLVVGYISPDLFVHSVSYFAEAPLTWHSPQVVSPIVYSCVMRPDAKTAKLKAAALAAGGQWRDVAGLSEHELATMVGACLQEQHAGPIGVPLGGTAVPVSCQLTPSQGGFPGSASPVPGAQPCLADDRDSAVFGLLQWEPVPLLSRAQSDSGAAVLP